MSHRRDYYEVLGISRTATQAEIRRAFRQLARAAHPDLNAGSHDSEREFKRINRAYETLGDVHRREQYDQRHERARFAGPGGGERASYRVDEGPLYHSDLGHHSDFYQAGDPMSVADAALITGRHPDVVRRAIRTRRLRATLDGAAYLLRRRDIERWDKATPRRSRSREHEPGG